jgi:hypothetical protein
MSGEHFRGLELGEPLRASGDAQPYRHYGANQAAEPARTLAQTIDNLEHLLVGIRARVEMLRVRLEGGTRGDECLKAQALSPGLDQRAKAALEQAQAIAKLLDEVETFV